MGKALMLQGTMSDSGKSFITAGICRYFSDKGYKVAPFKSQNMASNCYITDDGLQLGRAQALQAVAARCPIDARLNPILLKPKTNVGSEIIIEGRSHGFMSAKEYFKVRKTFFPVVESCFKSLMSENDLVIIEGAGSPAEINLKKDDIVNMGIAKMAKAPVLLIGDIDRGGVFASLYGTYMLLEESEKQYVKGFVINKFRGDKSLLMPGIDMFYEKIPVDTVGIMPYLDIVVDEEDSLSKKSLIRENADIEISVIDFNGMKNFHDFLKLKEYNNLSLKYVKDPLEAEHSDIIVIPDFELDNFENFRYKKELKSLIKNKPTIVLGAGSKILNNTYRSKDSYIAGLGLLNLKEGKPIASPVKKECVIEAEGSSFWKFLKNQKMEGFANDDAEFIVKSFGNILVSSLSGFFSNSNVTKLILENLLKNKGKTLDIENMQDNFLDGQLDILSKAIEENLDMEKIERIVEEGI